MSNLHEYFMATTSILTIYRKSATNKWYVHCGRV